MKKPSPKKTEPSTALVVEPVRVQTLLAAKMGTPQELSAIAIQLHREIGITFGRGLWLSAYCGKVLGELKKALGHGKWLPFVDDHLASAGIGARTAQRYMDIWTEARGRLLKCDTGVAFADKPIEQLTSTEAAGLMGGLQKICKGETARSLCGEVLEDAGIAKRPHGHALRANAGGDRGGRRGKLTPEEQETIANEAAGADRDNLIDAAAQVIREESWLRWSGKGEHARKLEALLGDLTDISARIKGVLKAQ